MTDPSDVLTSEHLATMQAGLKKVEPLLQTIKVKGAKVPFFAQQHAELSEMQTTLTNRIERLRSEVGRRSRKDRAVVGMFDAIKAHGTRALKVSKAQEAMTFYYGKTKVASDDALLAKVKAALPQLAKNCASGALNDALKGDAKDASKFGTGLRHASAGAKNVKGKSCTVFFTREKSADGLETVLTIKAVGGHTTSGSASYEIFDSSTDKLQVGKEYSL